MPADPMTETDARVLALFESPGAVETPTPGARAWLARDTSDRGLPVLIKRLTSGSSGKGRATDALALDNPNIVRTRRWLFEGGALYVIREVVRGRNLKQAFSGTSGPTPEALERFLLPVVSALEYAHGLGVAHGGVSPENILLGDDGNVYLCDFATTDSKAPQHFISYSGSATVGGDVTALGKTVIRYLPTSGAFANPVVRGRIEGVIERCDSLSDLKTTILALEKLAMAPVPKGSAPPVLPASNVPPVTKTVPPPATKPASATPQANPIEEPSTNPAQWVQKPGAPFATDPPLVPGQPRLTLTLAEKTARVAQGGGGIAAMVLKNDGEATLIVRMIATQHAWLNVRPIELPLTLQPGSQVTVGFAVSAARLTPGEYRSEVYFSANATGKGAEDLKSGWFKHTGEVRITVEGAGTVPAPSPSKEIPSPQQPGRLWKRLTNS